eukprot:Filipodium_phascolosomae@DN368_c0_g1_i1.p1
MAIVSNFVNAESTSSPTSSKACQIIKDFHSTSIMWAGKAQSSVKSFWTEIWSPSEVPQWSCIRSLPYLFVLEMLVFSVVFLLFTNGLPPNEGSSTVAPAVQQLVSNCLASEANGIVSPAQAETSRWSTFVTGALVSFLAGALLNVRVVPQLQLLL